ncbi:MAG: NUDIX domain-containing protein [Bdellovibrionales bacterium]|nr:NUDIX domain-containing protein [Bdellovibrionales bacterium]
MAKHVEKVLAYITRIHPTGMELLVFDHVGMPEAGIQVPAGTVDPGETPSAAVLREVEEETGLSLKTQGCHLGRFDWYRVDRDELHFRNVFHFELTEPIADEWQHVVSGSGEDHQLNFKFYWLPIDKASQTLAVEQGLYTKRL